MPASIEAAKAGATTGEWGAALRAEFGEYRAPTGVANRARQQSGDLDALRGEVERVSIKLGHRLKLLVGKPGLDGHSNGAEQIATRALDAGLDVVYDGIRLTPQDIVARARDGVDCIGLSILSGSHLAMTREVLALMKAAGLARVPVVVGGIIPPGRRRGAARRGRRRRLHAEGLRPQRDHRRHRRPCGAGVRRGGAVSAGRAGAIFRRDGLFSAACATIFRRAAARRASIRAGRGRAGG